MRNSVSEASTGLTRAAPATPVSVIQPRGRRTWHVTADGLEHTFALNHLAPFLLTNLLL
jgi:hypothetical protein